LQGNDNTDYGTVAGPLLFYFMTQNT